MKFTTFAILVTLFSTAAMAQAPTIRYALGMSKPSSHLLEVEVSFDNLPPEDQQLDLAMPAWRPGRYVIFDFAGGVQEFSAVDGNNKQLSWSKVDKETWRIRKPGVTKVTASYKVYANEFNQRTRGLNDEHAFVDPASAFMYVDAYKNLPLTITVRPYGNWHVTTGLDPAPLTGNPHEFTAPKYEYFADCPIEVGTQKDFDFEAGGKKHVLMIQGEGNWDEKKIIPDLAKFIKANKEFWGELPYEHYTFMVHLLANPGGATEHINSTIIDERPFIFKNPDSYRGFLGTVSHEYFHTWNVKQLRPAGIHPYDFSKENYVRELWIAEGGTDYYGAIIMVRAGFLAPDKYLEGVAGAAHRDRLRPGNKIQSATECSFDAWVKFWRNNQQAFNSETDYYAKGADLFLLLDLEIRQRSANKRSLDNVMRALFERFPLSKKGYTVDDFQSVAEEFAGSSMKEFFADYVHGTNPLPWERTLKLAGVELAPKDAAIKPWLGIVTSEAANRTVINAVVAGSPAYEAGLNVGDEVLALNGYRVRTADLQSRVEEMKAGDKVKLTVFRENWVREFVVTLRNEEVPMYKILKTERPADLQKDIYRGWLKTSW